MRAGAEFRKTREWDLERERARATAGIWTRKTVLPGRTRCCWRKQLWQLLIVFDSVWSLKNCVAGSGTSINLEWRSDFCSFFVTHSTMCLSSSDAVSTVILDQCRNGSWVKTKTKCHFKSVLRTKRTSFVPRGAVNGVKGTGDQDFKRSVEHSNSWSMWKQ